MTQDGNTIVHYHRFDGAYAGWTLWTWPSGGEGRPLDVPPVGTDDFGAVFRVPAALFPGGFGLLPKKGEWADKDGPDRFWSAQLDGDAFIVQGDPAVYPEEPECLPRIAAAWLDAPDRLTLVLAAPYPAERIGEATLRVSIESTTALISSVAPVAPAAGLAHVFSIVFPRAHNLEHVRSGGMAVALAGCEPVTVALRYAIDDPYFTTDLPLGPDVSHDAAFFRVWAPGAAGVRVVISSSLPLPRPSRAVLDDGYTFPMQYQGHGVWELRLDGDYRNWFYRLDAIPAHDRGSVVPVYDPYARAINRTHAACILVDDRTEVADGPAFRIADAVIYEAHVRDFSVDKSAGAGHPGSFLALAEKGTHVPGDPDTATGLDHLRELGVNTLQLMPVHAFDAPDPSKPHNWGYMTLHFNAPEPTYASDGAGATAVRELKETISSLHRAHLKVVMDVVYNHSTEARDRAVHWNGLAPHYLYRTKPDGAYWNGSGCGNEFRSEGPMARKFLIDSLCYWAREYKVDGFRFDLMGLIDRDTMVAVVEALNKVRPGMFIYGEPWAGGTTPARVTGKGDQRGLGFGCFNDTYRIAVSGGVFDDEPGYAFNGLNRAAVQEGWRGSIHSFAQDPVESINFVETHDNRTWRDKIDEVVRAHLPDATAEDKLAIDRIGAFLVLLAQGVPFMHLGQDFYRTKRGNGNSYNAGDDVNKIRWEWKRENRALFDFYRGLAAIRNAHPAFRLPLRAAVEKRIHFGIIREPYFVCEIDAGRLDDQWRWIVAIVNPLPEEMHYEAPAAPAGWDVHVHDGKASVEPLFAPMPAGQILRIPPRSCALIARRR